MTDGEVRDYRSLGEILREAREKRGWTIGVLSNRTRIAPRMLSALESDDLDQFDSPVYVRGFVRSLAQVHDLEVDWLLTKLGMPERQEEAAVTAEPEAVIAPPLAPVALEETAPGPVWEVESVRVHKVRAEKGGGAPWRAILIATVLVVVAGVMVVSMRGGSNDEGAQDPFERQGSPLTVTTGSSSDSPVVVANGHEGEAESERAGDPEPDPSADAPAAATAPPAESDTEVLVPATQPTRGLPSVVRGDTQNRDKSMALVIRARSRVELRVAVDAAAERRRILESGQEWTLNAADHFSIRVSEPDAVSFELDGILRDPPPDWSGTEWILYPLNAPD